MRIFSTSALPSSLLQSSSLAGNTSLSNGFSSLALQTTQLSLRAASTSDALTVHVTQMPADLGDDDVTYDALGQAHLAPGQLQVWEQAPDDAISQRMASNAGNNSAATRLSGLGSALLAQLGSGVTQYRQTVVNTTAPSSRNQIQAKASNALNNVQDLPSEQVELHIKTRSGVTVTLRLVDQQETHSGGTGLVAEITADGKISAPEQSAIQSLATGLEQAIQGLVSDETQVNLQQLGQFDSTQISSLELAAHIYGRDANGVRYEKLGASFKATDSTRDISLSRPDGKVSMSIDLGQPAFWGSAAQKAKAVDQYLAHIDEAAARGHANQDLVQLFKSSFSSLTASYGSQGVRGPGTSTGALNEDNASWLTGLADFKAQLTATSRASNPRKLQELDRFQYTVDQTTTVTGFSVGNRTIDQTQDAHLSAAYHQSLFSPKPPILDSSTASQNYYYMQVDDSSSTHVQLQFDKNALVAASLTQLVTQSLRTQKFERNQLVQDDTDSSTTPSQTDLLPLLRQLDSREARHQITAQEKQQLLASWNDRIFKTPAP